MKIENPCLESLHRSDFPFGLTHRCGEPISAGEMQARDGLYKKEIAPALQPFFVGDDKTYRCDVKHTQ